MIELSSEVLDQCLSYMQFSSIYLLFTHQSYFPQFQLTRIFYTSGGNGPKGLIL